MKLPGSPGDTRTRLLTRDRGIKSLHGYPKSSPNYGEYAMRGHAPYSDGIYIFRRLVMDRPIEAGISKTC